MSWNCSRDAERILAIPAIHVPGFAARVQQLAADPAMTFDRAVEILDAELQAAGVTQLDFEMCQPGNAHRAPFAIAPSASGEGTFQAMVSSEVRRIYGAMK